MCCSEEEFLWEGVKKNCKRQVYHWGWSVITALSNSVYVKIALFPAHQCALRCRYSQFSSTLLCNRRARKKRDDIAGFISMSVFFQGSKTLSEDGNLFLDNISYDEAGEYICEGAVPSVPGLKVSASVNLSVEGNNVTHVYMYTLQRHTNTACL